MRLWWGLSRVANRASVSPSGKELHKVGTSPHTLPFISHETTDDGFLPEPQCPHLYSGVDNGS